MNWDEGPQKDFQPKFKFDWPGFLNSLQRRVLQWAIRKDYILLHRKEVEHLKGMEVTWSFDTSEAKPHIPYRGEDKTRPTISLRVDTSRVHRTKMNFELLSHVDQEAWRSMIVETWNEVWFKLEPDTV
jgi:hypothetical protein